MERHWYVIINPKSGGGKAKKTWEKFAPILKNEGIQITATYTKYPLHAIELVAEAINQGFRQIMAVGGDGTISEVVNGIFHQKTISTQEILFTAIPTGTGNDWARYHEISAKKGKAISTLKGNNLFAQDIGKITYQENGQSIIRYFNNVAGLGFESYVTKQTEDINKAGFIGQSGYLVGVLKNLFSFTPAILSAKAEEFTYEKECFLITIGICKHNGNGMNLVPLAKADDGLFDVTILDKVSPWNVIYHILKIYNGKVYRHPKAYHYRTTKLSIGGDMNGFIEADGEVLGNVPIEIELIPQSLNVLIPPNTGKKNNRFAKK